MFTKNINQIIIDNHKQTGHLHHFVKMFIPKQINYIKLYKNQKPIFNTYNIKNKIGHTLTHKIPLNSNNHLIIDQTKTLTTININTKHYVNKKNKNLKKTILQTNLKTITEITYQLQFHNIKNLIILNLINIKHSKNHKHIQHNLEALLTKNKTKTTLNQINNLNLIEITHKHTQKNLKQLIHKPYFYYNKTKQLINKKTITYKILQQIHHKTNHLKNYNITINTHPTIINVLKTKKHETITKTKHIFIQHIILETYKNYHIEQFNLQKT